MSDVLMDETWDDCVDDALNERNRAVAKHGWDNTPLGSSSPAIKLAILTEEVGEVARWVCERELGNRPDYANLYDELTQVAAVALMWAENVKQAAHDNAERVRRGE